MAENKLITIAVHKKEKAHILEKTLLEQGIEAFLEDIVDEDTESVSGIAVRVRARDLGKALTAIESSQLFRYDDHPYKMDDGSKKILVSVDFSDYSMKACQVAFNIAKEIGAKVKILHVYHNFYYPSSFPFADTLKSTPDEGMLRKARKQMLDLCVDIEDNISNGLFPSVNYSYSLREGLVEEEIELFVKEYKPTLIVAGTKGKDNNKTHLLGSVTADIIEMTNVPVLALPENSPLDKPENIKHIAFLTNLQSRDMASFDMLVKLLKSYTDIRITLIHINRINKKGDRLPEEQLAQMKAHFESQYPQFNIGYQLIENSDLPLAINEYAMKEGVTLICLNTRKRNLFGRMFWPSLSRKVLFKSNVALLVLRG